MAYVCRLEFEQTIAVPFVDNYIHFQALTDAAAEVPDKWRFGQLHKQVEVVGQIAEEMLLYVFVERATEQAIELHKLRLGETIV